ncbi:MAG: TIGR00374 family protein, partial [Cytophagia bacterium]|nr:TIGR00374 family protein [Cytophagia bacterium]
MENSKARKVLNPRSVWLPVLIGLIIIAYLAYRDDQFSRESLQLFSDFKLAFVALALLLMIFKDGLNALRVRWLSHGTVGVYPAIRIVLLWEFAIAVTPPVLGAAAVLVFIIFKEGQPFGKALAYTLLLAILDNLFFLTASPLVFWLTDGAVFPVVETTNSFLQTGVSKV